MQVYLWKRMKQILQFIFFGNIFYGICAFVLAVEAGLQQYYPVNEGLFYLLACTVTILYYNFAYLTEKSPFLANPRALWYERNHIWLKIFQTGLSAIFIISLSFFVFRHGQQMLNQPVIVWCALMLFPLVAVFYYGIDHRMMKRIALRNIGWLKPFIIGFSWAGLVTVFPVFYYCIVEDIQFKPTLILTILFIKNFMFISLLCILFDIKDYATDYNLQLKTFVVNIGLRRTIFFVIIPLAVAGLGSFVMYGYLHHFPVQRISMNMVPFLLLIAVAYSLQKRRSIFYYLIIIDGLMLVKAVCGIAAMI